MHYYFDHERLEVYQVGRQFNREVRQLLEEVPRGHGDSPAVRCSRLTAPALSLPRMAPGDLSNEKRKRIADGIA